jgi:DNA-directed RNA polymerase subunit RPC12/RpoP
MSRKYSHQGYQDSDRDNSDRRRSKAPPRKQLTEEERIQRRSMRHAIDREAQEVVRCHNCGRKVHDFGSITKTSACPHCRAMLHCCRTCVHFDSATRWQCKADIDAPVGDKNKANDCTKYEASLVLDVTGRRTTGSQSGDPRSQFDSLFKS